MRTLAIGLLTSLPLLAASAAQAAQYDISTIYMSSGNPQTALAYNEDNKVNDTLVNCPAASCMVAVTLTDQFCPADIKSTAEPFRIRLYLDGVLVRDAWVWGRSDVPLNFHIACRGADWLGNVGIQSGPHTLSFYTYWPWPHVPATQGTWTTNYLLTTPHH
ncbi:MAG TPA: hypothetical protein VIM02_15070 [Rhizomicrobium sp.]|jgi:hypothetical protein